MSGGSLLLRHLHRLAVYAAAAALLLVAIPRDPENARWLGLSASRLGMLGGLALLALVCAGTAAWLARRPAAQQAIDQRLRAWLARRGLRSLVLSGAAGLALPVLYTAAELALTSDHQVQGVLLRLLPLLLFILAAVVELLSSPYLAGSRLRWELYLAGGVGMMALAAGLQPLLWAGLERPFQLAPGLVALSRLLSGWLGLLFFALAGARPAAQARAWLLALLLAFLLALLQWFTYPRKYWSSQPALALWMPALALVLTLLCQVLQSAWMRLQSGLRPGLARRALALLAVLGLAILAVPYTHAAVRHSAELNYAPIFTDQGEYLAFARSAYLNGFRYTGDHNRMPGYPYLQGLFYQQGMSDADFFWQGKLRNIALSLLLLAALLALASQRLGWLQAAYLTGIVAFSLYIFKSAYFQAEILYYFLAFLVYALSLAVLRKPSARLGLGLGLAAGLAHLVKASILPGFGLLLGVFAWQQAARWLAARRLEGTQARGLAAFSRFAPAGLALVAFFLVIWPYIQAMHARFGSYFYNVNTTFYVWYDDNFAAIEAEAQHHFAERYPSHLSPDELPSLRNYLRTHSPEQIWARLQFGLSEQGNNLRSQFSVTNYHLSYLLVLALAVLAALPAAWRLLKQNPYPLLFTLLYLLAYLALFVWYSPISPERRFTYGLYLPFMLAVFSALNTLQRDAAEHPGSWLDLRILISSAHLMLALSLALNIYLVLTERMFFDRYGA